MATAPGGLGIQYLTKHSKQGLEEFKQFQYQNKYVGHFTLFYALDKIFINKTGQRVKRKFIDEALLH